MVQFSIQSGKKNVELLSQELCSWWWWLWWQDEGSDFPIRMIMASQNWRLIRFLPWTPLSPFSNREPTDILQQNFVPLLIFCSSLSFICRYNQVSFDLHWEIPLLRYTTSNSNQTAQRRKIILIYCFRLFDMQCFSVVTKCGSLHCEVHVPHYEDFVAKLIKLRSTMTTFAAECAYDNYNGGQVGEASWGEFWDTGRNIKLPWSKIASRIIIILWKQFVAWIIIRMRSQTNSYLWWQSLW